MHDIVSHLYGTEVILIQLESTAINYHNLNDTGVTNGYLVDICEDAITCS